MIGASLILITSGSLVTYLVAWRFWTRCSRKLVWRPWKKMLRPSMKRPCLTIFNLWNQFTPSLTPRFFLRWIPLKKSVKSLTGPILKNICKTRQRGSAIFTWIQASVLWRKKLPTSFWKHSCSILVSTRHCTTWATTSLTTWQKSSSWSCVMNQFTELTSAISSKSAWRIWPKSSNRTWKTGCTISYTNSTTMKKSTPTCCTIKLAGPMKSWRSFATMPTKPWWI